MSFFRATWRVVRAMELSRQGDQTAARLEAGRQAPLVDIGEALASLPAPRLSRDGMARIEGRIHQQLFGSSLVIQRFVDAKGRIVQLAEPVLNMPPPPPPSSTDEQTAKWERESIVRLLQPQITTRVDEAPAKRGQGRKALASVAAVTLLFSIGLSALRARPGSLTYPLKLQVEALRLSLAGEPLNKAGVYMAISATRLRELERIDAGTTPWLTVETLGRMDAATIASFELLRSAPHGFHRTALLTSLAGLVTKQEFVLNWMLSNRASDLTGARVLGSLALAGDLASSIRQLLGLQTASAEASIPSDVSRSFTSAASARTNTIVSSTHATDASAPEGSPDQHSGDPGTDGDCPAPQVVPDGFRDILCRAAP